MDDFQNFDNYSDLLTTASTPSAILESATSSFDVKESPITCKEKLVVFFDRCSEIKSMELSTTDGKRLDPFDRLKKLVRIYLQLKNAISHPFRNDEYYLLTESTNGKFNSAASKTDVDTVLSQLKKVTIDSKSADDHQQFFQLDDILRRIFEIVLLPPEPVDSEHCNINPPYIELTRKLRNPFLYVDVLYLHENPSSDNNVNAISSKLRILDNKKGYFFDTGPNITNWHNCSAFLLTHPFVRLPFAELQKSNRILITTGDSCEANQEKVRTDEKLIDV